MSGTTFATYPVQSQNTTQATPKAGSDNIDTLEQGYLSAVARHTSAPPAPPAGGGYAPGPGVTTLAIGEEDGGAMGPAHDMNAVIGGGHHGATVAERPAGLPQGYGTMQPIYSPGEPEYPAFAKTSQTTDILNFHPVARVQKTTVAQSAPPPAAAPAPVQAPVADKPVAMAAAPVGSLPEPVAQSGNFESVGSYDDYINSLSSGGATPAPASTAPAPEAPATYETFTPVYEKTAPAPSSYTAPVVSAHPQQKPAIVSAPASTPMPQPSPAVAATPAPEATYISVSIDDYIVDPASTGTTAAPASVAPSSEPQTIAPAPVAETTKDSDPVATEPVGSLGGSFVVIDTAPSMDLPAAGSAGDAGKAPSGLEIMTLAIGEESGTP